MQRIRLRSELWLLACGSIILAAPPHGLGAPSKSEAARVRYELRSEHDPDGTGKLYMGREIAAVMGHSGAEWLERREREAEERPDLLMAALKLKPGDVAADIGAGTGYYTWRLATQVGERGLVYAVDIQPEMLELLARNLSARQCTNYRTVLGAPTDPQLPERAMDLVLLVDVYHEFSHPFEMAQLLCRALKPGGRLVFVEFRAEDPEVPIKTLHKMSEAQIRREMSVQPVEWVETIGTLPWQHAVIFRNRSAPRASVD
jgi:ubiquinone/menaquinone biosynthesis C-methylase UbiE